MSSSAMIVAVVVVVRGMDRKPTASRSWVCLSSGLRRAGDSPAANQSGSGARVYNSNNQLKYLKNQCEKVRAEVDGSDLATWHDRHIQQLMT